MGIVVMFMPSVCFLCDCDSLSPSCASLRERLSESLENAVYYGYHHFLCGFGGEADCIFAALVLALKKEYPRILLEACLPYYEESLFSTPPYRNLLAQCDQIMFFSEKPDPNSRERRDLAMLRRCSLALVALGSEEGTDFTLRQALLERDRFLELI